MDYDDKDYYDAHKAAQDLADRIGREVGIERMTDHLCGGDRFSVKILPNSENRYGHELRCEVVAPRGQQSQPVKGPQWPVGGF